LEEIIAYISLVVYNVALLFISYYSLTQIYILYCYLTSKRTVHAPDALKPHITIQLPIYNEGELVNGLLDSISALTYPKEKIQIQVLDDSTDDDTLAYSQTKVKELEERGFDIKLFHRKDRSGFKAGALAEGLKEAKGEFIAIFDTDFRPKEDFFTELMPEFNDPDVGVVQAKWGHINRDFSLLTKLQAFQLDVHFTVEQKGRQKGNLLLQFNGTCGLWRMKTIEDAGGWDGDTLTEDLDLSYRAQMKGWKITYREDYTVPGLLPYTINSFKSQQHRWMKGGAENAIKHVGNVLGSSLSFKQKYFAIHHLLGSYVFIAILLSAVASVPLSYYISYLPIDISWGAIFTIPMIITILIYFVANRMSHNPFVFVFRFVQFLSLSMGLSLHNSKAVWEAIIRKKTAFIKTPKEKKSYSTSVNPLSTYIKKNPVVIVEALLGLYFAFGIYVSVVNRSIFLFLYYLLLCSGFLSIFFYSILQFRKPKQ